MKSLLCLILVRMLLLPFGDGLELKHVRGGMLGSLKHMRASKIRSVTHSLKYNK